MIKTNKIALAAGLILALTLMAGCVTAPPAVAPTPDTPPTLDLAALKQEIASTVIAEITRQAPPTATEVPAGMQPTYTPWVITATANPAQTQPTLVMPVVPSATRKPGGGTYPTITPTYYTDAARLSSQKPPSYSVFVPGYDFDASWTVENTGHRQWTTEFYYILKSHDGTESGPHYLPALKVGETFTAVMDVTAPTTPGNYTNTLRVINNDGVTFFSSAFIFTVK